MAEMDSSSSNLTQDVRNVLALSYPIEAMLTGALSLIEAYRDENGNGDASLFHAQQLVEMANAKAQEIYLTSDDMHIIERTKTLEAAGVSHV